MPPDFDETGRALRSAFGGSESLVMEVLGQIRDNMRRMSEEMVLTRNTVEDVKGRVIALEVRNQRLDAIEAKADSNSKRIDALEGVNDKRSGAVGFVDILFKWAPIIAVILGAANAAWLYGRSLGITPAPPGPQQHIEAKIQPDEKTIQGQVGTQK